MNFKMNNLIKVKNELCENVHKFNQICLTTKDKEKTMKMKQKENELWKKYKFFDEYIKAERKVRK